MTEILNTTTSHHRLSAVGEDESASTHDRLLSSAALLFAERGYGGTSMADIAERVGVRKASLYNYYPSKEDILMELLHRGLEAAQECCLPALHEDGPFAERLWQHFRATVRFATEQADLVVIFRVAATQIGGELGERANALVAEHRSRLRHELVGFFREAVAAGAVVEADPQDLAYVFRMFSNGVLTGHLGVCDVDERLAEERLERIWNLFWNGIGGTPTEEDLK